MSESYRIKNEGRIVYGGRTLTNDNLTDEVAEELLKQRGMERTIEKVSKKSSPPPKDESGSSKK